MGNNSEEEERHGMGVEAKSRKGTTKMGSISSLGSVTSLNSTIEGSLCECFSVNVSSYSPNMSH